MVVRLLILGVLLFAVVGVRAEIVDANLKKCVEKHAQKHNWQSPSDFTELVCHNQGIRTLEGLQAYGQLKKLSLHKNKLTRFDIQPFPLVAHLNLARNDLRGLTIENHDQLSALYLFNNRIEKLKLSGLPKLTHLKGNSNEMSKFHYENTPALKKVYLFDNDMEHIDIHSLPALTYMDVRENPMPDELYEDMDAMRGVTILHDGNAEDWNP